MLDNIFIRALAKIFDLLVLNLLWVFCSLPVVTLGASTAALYSVTLKMAANEEGYIVRGFFQAWKENFRQSTGIWAILLAAGCLLGVDFAAVCRLPAGLRQIAQVLFGAVLLVYAVEALFVFPLIARFENTTVHMLANAVLIPVSRLPYTVCAVVMTGFCIMLTFLNARTVQVGAVVWSLIGVSALAFANSFLMRRIFEPFEKR